LGKRIGTGNQQGELPLNPRAKKQGHPIMYGKPQPVTHFDPFPDGGGYPKGFIEWALQHMNAQPEQILHLCSGSVKTGTTIDIRPQTNPHIVADCRQTPFPDETFTHILADPPYSQEYANNLYNTANHYPTPYQIIKEASRILKPGGLIGLLHTQIPVIRKPMKILSIHGITLGCGYHIRAWTLLEKQPTHPQNTNPLKGL